MRRFAHALSRTTKRASASCSNARAAYAARNRQSSRHLQKQHRFSRRQLRHTRKLSAAPQRAVGRLWCATWRRFWPRALFMRRRQSRHAKSAALAWCQLSNFAARRLFSVCCKAWTRWQIAHSSTRATNRTAMPRRFRRLHVIAGDANMSEYATALRVGATNLVVALARNRLDNAG